MRRLFIGLATIVMAGVLALCVSLAASAQQSFSSTGGTVAVVEGSVVTITVTIDLLLGGVGETEIPEGAQAGADELAAAIAAYWNQGFERLANDCVEFKLVVKINARPMSEHGLLVIDDDRIASVTRPGHHVVIWGVNTFGNAAPPTTYDPYDTDGYAPPGEDYSTPYEHELEATWSPRLEDDRDAAHEFGHLLGFGDDYGPGGEALPGREGTLMADGDFIDQNLVSRLARLVRDSGTRIPECWEGTYRGTVTWDCGPLGTQRGELEGSFKLAVAGRGAATLKGENTVTGSCAGPTVGTLTTPITVTGERTAAGFELPGVLWGPPGSFTIDVTGDHGSGVLQGPAPGPAQLRLTFVIDCVSC